MRTGPLPCQRLSGRKLWRVWSNSQGVMHTPTQHSSPGKEEESDQASLGTSLPAGRVCFIWPAPFWVVRGLHSGERAIAQLGFCLDSQLLSRVKAWEAHGCSGGPCDPASPVQRERGRAGILTSVDYVGLISQLVPNSRGEKVECYSSPP